MSARLLDFDIESIQIARFQSTWQCAMPRLSNHKWIVVGWKIPFSRNFTYKHRVRSWQEKMCIVVCHFAYYFVFHTAMMIPLVKEILL